MEQHIGSKTISEAVGSDHEYMDLVIQTLKSATSHEERIQWRNQLTWTFARHAISEELTWYPAMEKLFGEKGIAMAELDRQQHQAIKEDLYQIQSMNPDDARFFPLVEKLEQDFKVHVKHEKEEDMPMLEERLTRKESNEMAKWWQRTKGITPTRSHPSAPNRPYAENLVGLLAMPIDKVGDWVRSFPEDDRMEEVTRTGRAMKKKKKSTTAGGGGSSHL
ncbi:hypothetical protein SMMN14_09569 [Sphaerulina musiva]